MGTPLSFSLVKIQELVHSLISRSFFSKMAVAKSTKTFCHEDMEELEDVPELMDITGIRKLMLGSTSLKRIGPFNPLNCAALLCLDMERNEISKINGLEPLVNLTYLNLSHNKIIRIENFHVLKNLRFLLLNSNFISKIEGLDALVKLELLHLCDNKIRAMKHLNHLVNLIELKLTSNAIEYVENIECLEKLRHLDISDNGVTSLEFIPMLKNLRCLIWDSNSVEYLDITTTPVGPDLDSSPVAFPNLTQLSVCYNKIAKKSEISKLQSYKKLEQITLYCNPVVEELGDSFENQKASFAELLPNVKLNLGLPEMPGGFDLRWC